MFLWELFSVYRRITPEGTPVTIEDFSQAQVKLQQDM
jgi:hypothetical protein